MGSRDGEQHGSVERRRRVRTWGRRSAAIAAALVAFAILASALSGGGRSGDRGESSGSFSSVGTSINSAGGGGGADETDLSSSSAADGDTDGSIPAAGPADDRADTGAELVAQGPIAGDGRKIISTAELTVAVADVGGSVTRAVDAAGGVGAVLYGQDSTLEEAPTATLTFKVVPDSFAVLQERLAELGELRAQRVTTDDVTEQVVDLEARIATTRASVERIRALIGEAVNVMDIASLEGELLRRETELESLEGQLRTLSERVDLATVVLTLVQADPGSDPDDPLPAVVLGSSEPGFTSGLTAGWDAFVAIGGGLLIVIGALVPFVPIALAALLVWRLVRHRPALRGGVAPPSASTVD